MAAKRLLAAWHYNWGVMTTGDWKKTAWTVYENGTCTAESRFAGRLDSITHKTVLSPDALEKLRSLLAAEWEPFTDACDGAAWTFRTYDSDGHPADERGPGYIYGCLTLESIAALLPTQNALIRAMTEKFRQEG